MPGCWGTFMAHKKQAMADREERAKEANRDDHASRSRQWATVGSDDDEADAADGGASRKKKRSRDASDEGSDGSDSDDSSDNDESDEDGSGGSDKKKRSKHSKSKHKSKKHKKEKHKKEKHKKHKKEKKSKRDRRDKDSSSSSSSGSGAINQNEFGKYGIIREENFFAKQREFEAYMTEVKGMPGVMGQSKREVMECFRGFMEDYNTATMPHLKYYNLEAWEMDEYRREQQSKSQRVAVGEVRASFNDEDERRAELRRQKAAQEKREFDAVKARMAADAAKQLSMRRQGTLQAELQLAFKRGDVAEQKRLQRLLEPEQEAPAAKHPWAA